MQNKCLQSIHCFVNHCLWASQLSIQDQNSPFSIIVSLYLVRRISFNLFVTYNEACRT